MSSVSTNPEQTKKKKKAPAYQLQLFKILNDHPKKEDI